MSFGKIFPFVILVEDLPKKLPDTDSPTENDKPKKPKQTNWKEGLSPLQGSTGTTFSHKSTQIKIQKKTRPEGRAKNVTAL